MNSRSAWFAMRSPLMRQLPRRSSESQPYTAGTLGHFAIACATSASIGLELQRVDRVRLVDAKALGISHAHGLQAHQHVLILDALRDDGIAEERAGTHHRIELVACGIARQYLAADAAVGLDEFRAEFAHRHERHRAIAEAVQEDLSAERAIGIAESLARAQAHEGVALVDLEEELLGRYLVGAELRRD